jgi:hypothetical protein
LLSLFSTIQQSPCPPAYILQAEFADHGHKWHMAIQSFTRCYKSIINIVEIIYALVLKKCNVTKKILVLEIIRESYFYLDLFYVKSMIIELNHEP